MEASAATAQLASINSRGCTSRPRATRAEVVPSRPRAPASVGADLASTGTLPVDTASLARTASTAVAQLIIATLAASRVQRTCRRCPTGGHAAAPRASSSTTRTRIIARHARLASTRALPRPPAAAARTVHRGRFQRRDPPRAAARLASTSMATRAGHARAVATCITTCTLREHALNAPTAATVDTGPTPATSVRQESMRSAGTATADHAQQASTRTRLEQAVAAHAQAVGTPDPARPPATSVRLVNTHRRAPALARHVKRARLRHLQAHQAAAHVAEAATRLLVHPNAHAALEVATNRRAVRARATSARLAVTHQLVHTRARRARATTTRTRAASPAASGARLVPTTPAPATLAA